MRTPTATTRRRRGRAAAAAAAAGCAVAAVAAGQEVAAPAATGPWWAAANAWRPEAAVTQPLGFNFFEAAQEQQARNAEAIRDTFTGIQEAGQQWQQAQRERSQATLEAIGLGPALQQIEQMRLATQAQMDAFRDATFALLEGAFPGVRALPLAGAEASPEDMAAAGVTVREDGAVCKTYSAESIPGLDSPTAGEVISTIVVPDSGTLVSSPVITANVQHPRAGAAWISLRGHSNMRGLPNGDGEVMKRASLKKPCLKKDTDCPKGGKDLVGTVFTDNAAQGFPTDKSDAPFTGEVTPVSPLNVFNVGNGYTAGTGGARGRWVIRVKIPGKDVKNNPNVQWDLTLCMAPDAQIATFDDIVEKDDADAAAQAFTSAMSFPSPMVMPMNNFMGKFIASYGLAFSYAAIKHVVWHMKGEESTFELPKIETFDMDDWTHGWASKMKELPGLMAEMGKDALHMSLTMAAKMAEAGGNMVMGMHNARKNMLSHMHDAVTNFQMPKFQMPKFPSFNH